MPHDTPPALPALSGHFVIINVNRKLPAIVRGIQEGLGDQGAGRDIVVFVQDDALWRENPKWHPAAMPPHRLHIVEGCPGDPGALCRACVDQSCTALILSDPTQGELSDAKCALIALAIEHMNPTIHTIIELVHARHRVHFAGTEVNEVVCMGKLTEELLAQSTISPGILSIIHDLLEIASDKPTFVAVPVPKELAGLSYREAAGRSIEEERPYVICGFQRPGEGGGRRFLNPESPDKERVLQETDELIIVG